MERASRLQAFITGNDGDSEIEIRVTLDGKADALTAHERTIVIRQLVTAIFLCLPGLIHARFDATNCNVKMHY